jgi:hypothetical protein
VVPLQTFWVQYRDYTQESNPPILHRKEEFVAKDHPLRPRFMKLTVRETAMGLLQDPVPGRSREWRERLACARVTFHGHNVIRAP